MTMPGRTYSSPAYRYGFQGQEKDDEIKGEGNSYAFELRMLDSRVGRWFSMDPYDEYPSPYLSMGNNPISLIDPDGGHTEDNYLIKANGSITVEKTNDKTDSFAYEDSKGNITNLGTFDKNSNGLIALPIFS